MREKIVNNNKILEDLKAVKNSAHRKPTQRKEKKEIRKKRKKKKKAEETDRGKPKKKLHQKTFSYKREAEVTEV